MSDWLVIFELEQRAQYSENETVEGYRHKGIYDRCGFVLRAHEKCLQLLFNLSNLTFTEVHLADRYMSQPCVGIYYHLTEVLL